MVAYPDLLTNTADVLNVSTDGGEVRVDLGDVLTGQGISVESPVWSMDGFVSCPNLPESDECARALYIVDGDEKVVIGTYDARYAERVGELSYGDRAIIGKGPQRILVKEDRKSVAMYTENQTVDEAESTMMVAISGKDGVITITNSNAIITMDKDTITLAVRGAEGNSFLTLSPKGVTVGGNSFAALCKQGQLGMPPGDATAAAVPLTPPALGIVVGPTGIAGVGSQSWTCYPGPPV